MNILVNIIFGTIWCILLPQRSILHDLFTIESNGENSRGPIILLTTVHSWPVRNLSSQLTRWKLTLKPMEIKASIFLSLAWKQNNSYIILKTHQKKKLGDHNFNFLIDYICLIFVSEKGIYDETDNILDDFLTFFFGGKNFISLIRIWYWITILIKMQATQSVFCTRCQLCWFSTR